MRGERAEGREQGAESRDREQEGREPREKLAVRWKKLEGKGFEG